MRRDTAVDPSGVARSPGGTRTADRPRAPSTRRPPGAPAPGRRPPGPPPLRLTRRGLVVLGVLALAVVGLVVALVVAAVRIAGGSEPAPPAAVVAPSCVPDQTESLNCWPAVDEGDDPSLEVSPWVTGRLLAGDVRTVLDHVAQRFDAEVEPVDVASSWGWAYRPVRGEDGKEDRLSNHASGTSIDLNATEHPLGATGTFTAEQVEAIRSILAEVAPVVAWGGDFDGRVDEMHFEIVGDAEAVAEVAARLAGAAPEG